MRCFIQCGHAQKGQSLPSEVIKARLRLSLCLNDYYSMKTYVGVEVQLHAFLALALYGGEWSGSRSDRFTPRIRACDIKLFTGNKNFLLHNLSSLSSLAVPHILCRSLYHCTLWSSSVNIVTRLKAGRPGLDSLQGLGFFSVRHRVQTGSGAHPTSYPMGNGGKEAGAWSWPLTSI